MRSSLLARIILVSAVAFVLPLRGSAYGQDGSDQKSKGADATAAKKTALIDYLSQKADQVLTRYLEPDQYHINVAVELAESKAEDAKGLPYLLEVSGFDPSQVDGSAVQRMAKSVVVELFLVKEIPEGSRKGLTRILSQGLQLDEKRGDKVSVQDLELEIPKKRDEVEKKLDKIEAELKSASRDLEDSRGKLREAERTVAGLEKEKDDLADQLKESKEARESAKPGEQAPARAEETGEAFWIEKALYGLIAILVFVVLFLAAKIQASALKAVGDGIGQIGNGLQGIAGSMGGQDKEPEPTPEPRRDATPTNVSASGTVTAADMVQLKSQVGALQEEIVLRIDEETETILLDYITGLLANPETVLNAVATMELLGAERANELFEKLGYGDRGRVLGFIDGGGFGSDKFQQMLDAGENLKTKLLRGAFKDDAATTNPEVMQGLLTMSMSEISELLGSLDSEQVARLFLYLDPAKLASVLEDLCQKDKGAFENALEALPNLPNITERNELDDAIKGKITDIRENQADDTQLPYLEYYYNVVKLMDSGLAEVAISKIHDGSDRVGSYLRDRIITFGVLFQISDSAREEVVNGISNRDIAALVVGLDEELSEKIKALIPERRSDMVTEEIEMISHASKPKRDTMLEAAKNRVVASLTKLKASGELDTAPAEAEAQDSEVAA